MKVIYEAKDGTQFNTEEECQDYERRNSALYDITSFIATDKYGNPIPADGYGYSPDDFDYFCCFTEDGVKACEEFFTRMVSLLVSNLNQTRYIIMITIKRFGDLCLKNLTISILNIIAFHLLKKRFSPQSYPNRASG